MKKLVKSLLLSVAAVLFAFSASAQVTTSALNGRVADQNGEAIPGATIVAVHTPSAPPEPLIMQWPTVRGVLLSTACVPAVLIQ